jgi:Dual OB-containing domain
MAEKRILVLANSVRKFPCRCIAGREVASTNPFAFGSWVRPVSRKSAGELTQLERRLPDGSGPRLLDIIAVPVDGTTGEPDQPENHFISGDKPWKRIGSVQWGVLDRLVEDPGSLWIEEGKRRDRISADALQAGRSGHQSLYLIRPEDLELRFWTDYNLADGKHKRTRLAVFRYGGVTYDLALTDPLIAERHVPQFPEVEDGMVTVPLPRGTMLCVSLTHPWQGHHYKVAATVFESRT